MALIICQIAAAQRLRAGLETLPYPKSIVPTGNAGPVFPVDIASLQERADVVTLQTLVGVLARNSPRIFTVNNFSAGVAGDKLGGGDDAARHAERVLRAHQDRREEGHLRILTEELGGRRRLDARQLWGAHGHVDVGAALLLHRDAGGGLAQLEHGHARVIVDLASLDLLGSRRHG